MMTLPRMRWLQLHYECTSADVMTYRDSHDCTLVEANQALQPRLEPVLQYFDEDAQFWTDVPTMWESLGKKSE